MNAVFAVLLLVFSNGVILTSKYSILQDCPSLVFPDISKDEWNCIRGRLTEKGFTVSVGDTGQIVEDEIASDYVFNEAKSALTITITHQKHGCRVVTKALTEIVDACRDFEDIHQTRKDSGQEEWRIDAPNVKKAESDYRQIRTRRGDIVFVTAGGCVQHGGPGLTWALYIDPKKPNPNPYFFGQIKLPGMRSMTNLKEVVLNKDGFKIPADAFGDMFLKLGFTDFRFSDNGYWGREGDDGYDAQCKGVENAWVEIKIVHSR